MLTVVGVCAGGGVSGGVAHADGAGPVRAIAVTNTGPMIPAGEVERLFQPFQRLGADRTRHDGGHGLGLSIVQAIAAAHHATLDAYPCPTGGLRVTVTFSRDGAGR